MRLQFAFLADSATIPPDGKLYVMGGGIFNVGLPSFPQRIGLAAVAGFFVTAADAGKQFEIVARMVDADGAMIVPEVPMTFNLPPDGPPVGREVTVPTVLYFSPTLSAAGTYRVEYWLGDEQLGAVTFYVDQVNATAPATASR